MKKIQTAAARLDKLFAVLFWLVIAVGALNFAISAFMAAAIHRDPAALQSFSGGLSLDYLRFDIAPGYFTSAGFGMGINLMQALFTAVVVILVCLTLHILRGILRPMIHSTPFEGAIVSGLKKLGILALIFGIFQNVANWLSIGMVSRGYDLNRLFVGGNITGVTVNYALDLDFLLIAAVLFLLSYVFHYGQELQQLSDETL